MPYDNEDVFTAGHKSRASLSKSTMSPRKPPSRPPTLKSTRSTASLRGASLADAMGDPGSNARHSLAHELAVALMPEPSTGSKLLAEEFGIEYDEGAEGIDGGAAAGQNGEQGEPAPQEMTLDELEVPHQAGHQEPQAPIEGLPSEVDPSFDAPASPAPPRRSKHRPRPSMDAMDLLSQNVETTEKFLFHLRHIDADATSSADQPALETIASDIIRRIDETVRDREGQVRELLVYEREFRRIAAEINGEDVLATLDELEDMGDLVDKSSSAEPSKAEERHLGSLAEEPADWEVDPDQNHLGDEDDEYDFDASTPVKDSFPPPPPLEGPATPAKTIPQLTHLRTFTASLVSSLTTISEHTQVNGAATADAGRKIRALKNKLTGWRTEWDSAEQSRLKIERWEAGIPDGDSTPGTPTRSSSLRRRLDGRQIVEEHLRGFEQALAEASQKTQAIMAAS